MQFFLIDLALVLLALLAYRALSLAGRYRAAVVTLEHGVMPRPRTGSRRDEIAPPEPASAKPARREAMTPQPVPCGAQCRATLHRLINFW
jgi:hypothetical protein